MTALRHVLFALAALLLAVLASSDAGAGPVIERVVIVMRHGIRAPLAGEVPEGTRTGAPWPQWPVAESRITPHGVRALDIAAAGDRALLARQGLVAGAGCPAVGTVRIRTNSSARTIASGVAYAKGFARGCELKVEHRPLDEVDPIFEPLRARATRFDARAAVAAINQETGGVAALVGRHRAALDLLDGVLGCAPRRDGCLPVAAPGLMPSVDGHDLVLTGPIRSASGIAQVLLLQYAEGLDLMQVGWGRVDAAALQRLGALHAALFAVFTHPPYMAAHQAAVLGREVLQSVTDPAGPRVDVLMGHDTNVTALAAALRIELRAPGYATDDVPPGGALIVERLRDPVSGKLFVRVYYRTQRPETLRKLGTAVTLRPLRIPGCGAILCPAPRFAALLRRQLAPLVDPALRSPN
ncbi:histidine-type phosphatase [Sphingomonas crusticola]|uniref:histidine-type phosphatase n=1 Tax=Sphingomonas crusticola TaxID=1697973 RepID=UPI0013C2B6C9|nr:histidine-type phosphatase [Sphingomonas crusticola]